MAWAYCKACNHGLSEPSVAQVLGKADYCCSSCGTTNFTNKNMADVVLELHERLQALEQGQLNTVVLASSVELSLLENEAQWLKHLVQNPVYADEIQLDRDMREALFNKLSLALKQ